MGGGERKFPVDFEVERHRHPGPVQSIQAFADLGVLALTRGIGEIFLAFELRKAGKAAA